MFEIMTVSLWRLLMHIISLGTASTVNLKKPKEFVLVLTLQCQPSVEMSRIWTFPLIFFNLLRVRPGGLLVIPAEKELQLKKRMVTIRHQKVP
jgi:hypothetical protein